MQEVSSRDTQLGERQTEASKVPGSIPGLGATDGWHSCLAGLGGVRM